MANYYIGWDVGAWHSKKSSNSCDAIVVLNDKNEVLGSKRESISSLITSKTTTIEFIEALFRLCNIKLTLNSNDKIFLGADTPLAFPIQFVNLCTTGKEVEVYNFSENSKAIENPYLYRQTELEVYKLKEHKKPLSAVQDLIGSQASKGMLLQKKFAQNHTETGVWHSDDNWFTLIEVYPAIISCVIPHSLSKANISKKRDIQDLQDAYRCAYQIKEFVNNKESFHLPPKDAIKSEGWIWFKK